MRAPVGARKDYPRRVQSVGPNAPDPQRRHWWRGPVGLAIRLAITAAAVYYLTVQIDLSRVPAAMARLSITALTLMVVLNYCSVYLGVVRWRLLLRSFGAAHMPSRWGLYRLYLVGLFYNTFLPGGVGGDAVRGVASREAFGDEGRAEGLVVVLVERIMGMSALLVVVACATLAHPLPGIPALGMMAALGLLAAGAAVVALAMGPRIADALPEPLGGLLRQLPVPRNLLAFGAVLIASVAIHLMVAAGGHGLLHSMAVDASLLASLTIIPLASAMVFLPVSISGLGFFEAAFVALYGLIGVAEYDALAACIGFRLCYLLVAASGGLFAVLGKALDYAPASLPPAQR